MCKLQHGTKWLNAVVLETLGDSKVRVHVPMEEVPDQELEVTSSKLKPTRIEAFELFRHPCYPEGHRPRDRLWNHCGSEYLSRMHYLAVMWQFSGAHVTRKKSVEELLVADADFAVGDLVLRERFLLRGPAELPPLGMFRPVPPEVGTVEILGEEGFPRAVIFDNEHLKLLFEFMNSEVEVQQEVLAMQDSMHPCSETFQSTSRVAEWLVEQQLPWLDDLDFASLARLLRLFCVNSHPCKVAGNTSGLLKWGTMINHSCLPNVVYSSVRGLDGDFEGHFRACRPIKAGDILGVSYMKLQTTLAPMSLRRRMLWYLKGFICLCCRCSFEAAYADPARTLGCSSCGQMTWQFLPGFERHAFSCSCGKRADDAQTKNEQMLSSAVLGALCARWSGLSQAESALTDLQDQVSTLHEDHFAVRCLQLLFLALEGDESCGSFLLPSIFILYHHMLGSLRLYTALIKDWLMKHALPRNDLFLAKRAVEHQCSQEMVELLLERGCPRSSKGPLGPPLAIAARCGRLEVVRVLLDYGCDPADIEVPKHKLPDAAKSLLGYLVPREEAVLQKPLPLRKLRRSLAVQTLLPLASGLGISYVSIVIVAESCLYSAVNMLLRCPANRWRAWCSCAAAALSCNSRAAAPTAESLAKILSKWSDAISQEPTEPSHVLANAEEELRLCTPNELIRLEVPQKLLRERTFQNGMPKDVAAMLLQVVEEEEKFSVHVYRERQDVSLRVLTEPFCLLCESGTMPHVLALGDWHFQDVQQALVNDYKLAHLELPVPWIDCELVAEVLPAPLEPDEEELYMKLLQCEAKAEVRQNLVKLCEQCCVAVVSAEDNEIVDAIAQSVDGLLIQDAAVPLLKHFGWSQRDMEEQEDASFTLWDPPDTAPVLNSFFHLTIQPPPPNPPGPGDPVWSVIISFDAELPFELDWD
ncbi:Potential protein lysine methyltransferase SET5 (SET domain-containing protein 5) [Durusdinium trenchii]|uniref:Potential protein lysine methyltransferase SET5 (SET domain-containing protein 5) n=1 Tax=Durusdinium trenchii TaxID=1381693 RepID=A0ABP0HQD0_9DINO